MPASPAFCLTAAEPTECRKKENAFYKALSAKEAEQFEHFCAGEFRPQGQPKGRPKGQTGSQSESNYLLLLRHCAHSLPDVVGIYAERFTARFLSEEKEPSAAIADTVGAGTLALLRDAFPHRHLTLAILYTSREKLFRESVPLLMGLPDTVQKLIPGPEHSPSPLPGREPDTAVVFTGCNPANVPDPVMVDLYLFANRLLEQISRLILFDHTFLRLAEPCEALSSAAVFPLSFSPSVFVHIFFLMTFVSVSLAVEERETPVVIELQPCDSELHISWHIHTDMIPLYSGHMGDLLSLSRFQPSLQGVLVCLQSLLQRHGVAVSCTLRPTCTHPVLQAELCLAAKHPLSAAEVEFKHDPLEEMLLTNLPQALELLRILQQSMYSQKQT